MWRASLRAFLFAVVAAGSVVPARGQPAADSTERAFTLRIRPPSGLPELVPVFRAKADKDGTIPNDDIPQLKELGVAEVFTPGAPTSAIIDFIRGAVTP